MSHPSLELQHIYRYASPESLFLHKQQASLKLTWWWYKSGAILESLELQSLFSNAGAIETNHSQRIAFQNKRRLRNESCDVTIEYPVQVPAWH